MFAWRQFPEFFWCSVFFMLGVGCGCGALIVPGRQTPERTRYRNRNLNRETNGSSGGSIDLDFAPPRREPWRNNLPLSFQSFPKENRTSGAMTLRAFRLNALTIMASRTPDQQHSQPYAGTPSTDTSFYCQPCCNRVRKWGISVAVRPALEELLFASVPDSVRDSRC